MSIPIAKALWSPLAQPVVKFTKQNRRSHARRMPIIAYHYIFYFIYYILTSASLGMRKSERGENETDPILTPSGRHDRLNCAAKKRL